MIALVINIRAQLEGSFPDELGRVMASGSATFVSRATVSVSLNLVIRTYTTSTSRTWLVYLVSNPGHATGNPPYMALCQPILGTGASNGIHLYDLYVNCKNLVYLVSNLGRAIADQD